MRSEYKVIFLSIILGLVVWVIDAVMDYFFFYEGTFFGVLITDVPTHEVYMRSALVVVFIIFGIYISRILGEHKRVEDRIIQQSPFYQLVIVTIAIFVAELLVMVLLSLIPKPPIFAEALLDALILTLLVLPILYILVFRPLTLNIAERKRVEEQIVTFRMFADASGQGFAMGDLNGKIIYANPELLRLVGEEKLEDVVGKPFFPYYPEEFQERLEKEALPTVMREGQWVGELTLLSKDGKITPTIEDLFLIKDEKGNPLYLSVVMTDITERKKAEEALKKYSHDLEQSNKLKDLFIDIMQHDLLNPVTVIQGMVQLALREEEDPVREETFQQMLKSSKLIIDMIENASLLVKLESGEKLGLKEDDLGIILRSAVKGNSHLADENKTKITLHAAGGYMALVNPLIYDVFSNLISNALKYGPENSEVAVGITEDASNWRISVADNGEGIPNEYKETIFDRFKRVQKGGVKGTGLGLAIVKKVVESHNGRVLVEDNPEGGSIFYVTLPKVDVEEEVV